jgi:hypothetical protein
MNIFVKETLKVNENIKITNSKIIASSGKNSVTKTFHLCGTLGQSDDWKTIFKNIKQLKEIELWFEKKHFPEIEEVLKDFRSRLYNATANNKLGFIKNVSLTIDNKT